MTGIKAAFAVAVAISGMACLCFLAVPMRKLPSHAKGEAPMAMAWPLTKERGQADPTRYYQTSRLFPPHIAVKELNRNWGHGCPLGCVLMMAVQVAAIFNSFRIWC